MKELKWNYDEITAYWADRVKLTLPLNPQKQFEGSPLVENSWKKHITNNSFPEYCRHPNKPGYLLCSPSNIIRCFENDKVLEALVLTIVWGAMTRTKGKSIYTLPNKTIEEVLLKCKDLTKGKNSVTDSWNLLVNELKWSAVITSKCLHFLVRSLGYEINPPVPIDNAVIIKNVWPKFKELVKGQRISGDPSMCEEWWSYDASWDAYNRYMTAINCWSKYKGWTTTQMENTIFRYFTKSTNLCKKNESIHLTDSAEFKSAQKDWRKMSTTKQMQEKYWAKFFETSGINNKYWNKAQSHMIRIGQGAFWLEGWMNTKENLIGVEIVCQGEHSKENFCSLHQQKAEIEREVGFALVWQKRPDIISSYIKIEQYVESFHEKYWKEQHDWLTEKLKTFHRAFVPFIRKLGYFATDFPL